MTPWDRDWELLFWGRGCWVQEVGARSQTSQPTERQNYPATITVEVITPDNAAPAPCSPRLRGTVLTTRLLLLFVLLGAMT